MNPIIYFISDLHLEADSPNITESFKTFLSKVLTDNSTLYILGDFFEAWIGDDFKTPLSIELAEHLSELSVRGISVYFMHGNRDFLITNTYLDTCNASLVNDPTTLKLSGHTVSLMHGDTLCTDDISYQTYRKQVRDPSFQQMFLSKSIEERLAIARQIREQSKKNYQQRTDDRIMDVNQQAVEDEFKALNCKLLIHGHTHRPAIHRNKEQGHYRIVLGDWYAQESYLKYEDGVLELKSKGEKETLNLNEI